MAARQWQPARPKCVAEPTPRQLPCSCSGSKQSGAPGSRKRHPPDRNQRPAVAFAADLDPRLAAHQTAPGLSAQALVDAPSTSTTRLAGSPARAYGILHPPPDGTTTPAP